MVQGDAAVVGHLVGVWLEAPTGTGPTSEAARLSSMSLEKSSTGAASEQL